VTSNVSSGLLNRAHCHQYVVKKFMSSVSCYVSRCFKYMYFKVLFID